MLRVAVALASGLDVREKREPYAARKPRAGVSSRNASEGASDKLTHRRADEQTTPARECVRGGVAADSVAIINNSRTTHGHRMGLIFRE